MNTIEASIMARIGFMQGRLSPLINGKIQAFPWNYWKEEFKLSRDLCISLMEWTLDQDRLYENPLMSDEGRREIFSVMNEYGLKIPSVTGDCFMQAPFWKSSGSFRNILIASFQDVLYACGLIGIKFIVVPLVDNGRLESNSQVEDLVAYCNEINSTLKQLELKIVFESDMPPLELANFIDRFDPASYGLNYDIGNSASFGFDCNEEITSYGSRILNVHVKDRLLQGSTVPLGMGNAKFEYVFECLSKQAYRGNFILQTARACDESHSEVINVYRNLVAGWMKQYCV